MFEKKVIVSLQNLYFDIVKKKKRVWEDKKKLNEKIFDTFSLFKKSVNLIEDSMTCANTIEFFLIDFQLVDAYMPYQSYKDYKYDVFFTQQKGSKTANFINFTCHSIGGVGSLLNHIHFRVDHCHKK